MECNSQACFDEWLVSVRRSVGDCSASVMREPVARQANGLLPKVPKGRHTVARRGSVGKTSTP
jgi:hypothetical protein